MLSLKTCAGELCPSLLQKTVQSQWNKHSNRLLQRWLKLLHLALLLQIFHWLGRGYCWEKRIHLTKGSWCWFLLIKSFLWDLINRNYRHPIRKKNLKDYERWNHCPKHMQRELPKNWVTSERRGLGGKGTAGQDNETEGQRRRPSLAHSKEICGTALPRNGKYAVSVSFLSEVSKGFRSNQPWVVRRPNYSLLTLHFWSGAEFPGTAAVGAYFPEVLGSLPQ